MPTVFYNVQGDEGDDSDHPNCFRASMPTDNATLEDFVSCFPLAHLGTFHYRFKQKTDASDFGYIWKDVRKPQSEIPKYNGLIWAKVLQVSNIPTSITTISPRRTAKSKTSNTTATTLQAKAKVSTTTKPSSKPETAVRPKTVPVPKKQPAVDHGTSLFGTPSSRGRTSPGGTPVPKPSNFKDAPSTEGISLADITLAKGFSEKSEKVQAAMIQRAKELKAKQNQKVAKLKQKDEEAEALKKAKREAEGSTGVELAKWAKDSSGAMRKLQTLLCDLPKVLWTGTKWKPVDMGDVMEAKRVRLIYFKAMRIVHPDKLSADATPEIKVRAEHIFDALNTAWKVFQDNQ